MKTGSRFDRLTGSISFRKVGAKTKGVSGGAYASLEGESFQIKCGSVDESQSTILLFFTAPPFQDRFEAVRSSAYWEYLKYFEEKTALAGS